MSSSPVSRVAATTALRLEGRDVLDLLHRISTQSLLDLAAGEARATLFCDFRGRLLHRALVARLADDSVWLLRDDAGGAELAAYVDRHVFREDVRIEDRGETLAVRGTLHAAPPAGTVIEAEGRPARVGVAPGLAFETVARDAPPVTTGAEWERARIRAGWPRHGHEIAPTFHPFEVGCWSDVHLQKGCYTGQEVLLRLVTYDSVRRQPALVGGSGAAPATPAAVSLGALAVGFVTSALADGADWIGLAVLTHAACEPGRIVTLEDGRTLGRVEPFPARRPIGLPEP